jgi:hypothetical protein
VLFALLALGPLACGGIVTATEDPAKPAATAVSSVADAAAPPSSGSTPSATATSTSTPPVVPAEAGLDALAPGAVFCGQALPVHPGACSAGDFEPLVIGSWSLCSKPSVFGTNEDGLLIRADGHWSKLLAGSDGGLTAEQGSGSEGTWSSSIVASDGGCVDQLMFEIGGDGGGIGPFPLISAADDHMQLDNEGVFVGDYVRIP